MAEPIPFLKLIFSPNFDRELNHFIALLTIALFTSGNSFDRISPSSKPAFTSEEVYEKVLDLQDEVF